MGGGGKGGGGGSPKIPEFVKQSQQKVSERSKELFDITQPVMQEGVKQLQSLLTTGGPGAQVPIISNMEVGQQRAFNVANKEIADAMNRGSGGVPDASLLRLREQLGIEQQAQLQGIAPRVAAPFISAGMNAAIGGPQAAQQGYAQGIQALSSGARTPAPSRSAAGAGSALFDLLEYGAGGGFGGGGKGQGAMSNAWQVGGPTTTSSYGASAPGIQLEF